MIKRSKHIEIVRSSSKGLSSMSQVSCDAIFDVLSMYFTNVGVTVVNNLSDLRTLTSKQPDLVFLGMEFVPTNPKLGTEDPNKVWLSDYLDNQGIAYTGSNQVAHELERNKAMAKQRVLMADLKTPEYCIIERNRTFSNDDLTIGFPLFVKPANRGGGLGIDSDSVVHTFEQLQSKVHSIHTSLSSDALVEEYLNGREFSVAILKEVSTDEYSVMPIELIAPPDKNGRRMLGSKVKSLNVEQVLAVFDGDVKYRVMSLAMNVFIALGARDYGRIDIRLDADDKPYFLEANLIPSLISGYGSFPKACELNLGMDYDSMIIRITNLGLSHNEDSTGETMEVIKTDENINFSNEAVFGQI